MHNGKEHKKPQQKKLPKLIEAMKERNRKTQEAINFMRGYKSK